MSGVIATIPRFQFSSSTGAPLANGTLTVYVAGSTTPTNTWQDQALTILNTNPVALDSRGECVLWLDSAVNYKFLLKNAAGATQWTQDNISGSGGANSSGIVYTPAGTGAVATTVQAKLRESVSVKDFGAVGDGVTDDTVAIQAAYDALPALGGSIYFPAGNYKITATLNISKNARMRGDGASITNLTVSPTSILKSFNGEAIVITGAGTTIESLGVKGDTGNTGDGIVVKAGRITLRDVIVSGMGNDGIRIGTDAGGENCNLWYLENVRSKNNGRDGVRISEGSGGSADANGGTFMHGDLQSNTGSGLYLGNCQLNSFFGVTSQTNSEYGIYLHPDAGNCFISGGDWEGNVLKQLYVEAGSFPHYIRNMTVSAANCTFLESFNKVDILDFTSVINGIKFPPVQIPSADVNTLDDYEEGTWTPALTFATPGDLSVIYTTQTGRYIKVGSLVTVNFSVTTSAFTHTTASGAARLTGLPFISGYDTSGPVILGGVTLPSVVGVSAYSLSNVVQFYGTRSAAAALALTNSHFLTGASVVIVGSLTYMV